MGISLSDKLSASQYSLSGETTVTNTLVFVCTWLCSLHAAYGLQSAAQACPCCGADGGLAGETLGMDQGSGGAAHQTTLELAAAPLEGDLQVI